MTTKTLREKDRAIRQAVKSDLLLTEADIPLLTEREAIKARLKELDDALKPKITATIEHCGVGRLIVGSRQVELSRYQRASTSWAALATALIDEATINEHKPSFTVNHDIDSVKVLQ